MFIEFELEEDINVVSQDVRDKVSAIRGDLPRDIDPPIIEKFDPDSSPILAIVLSGPASIGELSDYADDVVKPRIEGVPGVGNVRLVGDREREVRIWLRADELRAHALTAKDVIDTLRKENLEPPGGRVETESREMIVKTKGKIEKVEDFDDLVVADTRRHPDPAARRGLGRRRPGGLPQPGTAQRPACRVVAGAPPVGQQHAGRRRRGERTAAESRNRICPRATN